MLHSYKAGFWRFKWKLHFKPSFEKFEIPTIFIWWTGRNSMCPEVFMQNTFLDLWSLNDSLFSIFWEDQRFHIYSVMLAFSLLKPCLCNRFFSTSHVIPHIRALVPCPGLTSEVCVVASTSVSLTPTEILFFCRVPDRNTVFL